MSASGFGWVSRGGAGLKLSAQAGLQKSERKSMSKVSSQTKQCAECRCAVDSKTMRPLSRTPSGAGTRYACASCYSRVTALRKIARDAHAQAIRRAAAAQQDS
jgi:hypothetical protein